MLDYVTLSIRSMETLGSLLTSGFRSHVTEWLDRTCEVYEKRSKRDGVADYLSRRILCSTIRIIKISLMNEIGDKM